MKLKIFLLPLLLFLSIPIYSQSQSQSPNEKPNINFSSEHYSELKEQVLLTEKARFAAMVVRNFEILDKVIHEDLCYIHSNGSRDTKDSFISAIKDGERSYEDITIEESTVRVYGQVGIINAKCTYHRTDDSGAANNLRLYYTSIYAMEDGRWQHVSWQSFRL